jgi:hypothetical protein
MEYETILGYFTLKYYGDLNLRHLFAKSETPVRANETKLNRLERAEL